MMSNWIRLLRVQGGWNGESFFSFFEWRFFRVYMRGRVRMGKRGRKGVWSESVFSVGSKFCGISPKERMLSWL
ncbi:hypothetical protein COLO4_36512 [Corchorus olitorius]|uniref:Uncharacterized protein n=1 Tax=Corchorus olitorius TaxID=93759 RepID=A0A1R3G8L8_9ROSI|nr:hypothetical protein COLO4_36512 [Corchorus olitorius]